jgi:ribosomal-protein-alanine N-acetyltransferase
MSLINTERAFLRRMTIEDFQNMRILESDPDIMKFTPSKIPQSENETFNRVKSQIQKQFEFEPFGIWIAQLHLDHSFVGWFMLIPKEINQLELGYMISRQYWNKGLATEICKSLIDYSKKYPQYKNIVAKTNTDNEASIKVLEKIGFVFKEMMTCPSELKVFQFNL